MGEGKEGFVKIIMSFIPKETSGFFLRPELTERSKCKFVGRKIPAAFLLLEITK